MAISIVFKEKRELWTKTLCFLLLYYTDLVKAHQLLAHAHCELIDSEKSWDLYPLGPRSPT